jgi:hypothetical protein
VWQQLGKLWYFAADCTAAFSTSCAHALMHPFFNAKPIVQSQSPIRVYCTWRQYVHSMCCGIECDHGSGRDAAASDFIAACATLGFVLSCRSTWVSGSSLASAHPAMANAARQLVQAGALASWTVSCLCLTPLSRCAQSLTRVLCLAPLPCGEWTQQGTRGCLFLFHVEWCACRCVDSDHVLVQP